MTPYDEPIPNQSVLRAKTGARQHPVDLDSKENTERAVDVRKEGVSGDNYYYREDNPPYTHRAPGSIPELYVREGVAGRLRGVNEHLRSLALELYIFDAYRPIEVQNYFHDIWVPNYLREQNPTWSEEQIKNEVGTYWAGGFPDINAVNPHSPPPHLTGAVVDLTIREINGGELLNMGGEFDEVTVRSFADYLECEGEHRSLSAKEEDARKNRRILYWVMRNAGFTVNPNEWWHFGVGDQLSARNAGEPNAVYSIMRI